MSGFWLEIHRQDILCGYSKNVIRMDVLAMAGRGTFPALKEVEGGRKRKFIGKRNRFVCCRENLLSGTE